MSMTSIESVRAPQYIPQVEELVGLPFFADPEQEAQLVNDHAKLDPVLVEPRAVLYTAALRLATKASREFDVVSSKSLNKIGAWAVLLENRNEIAHKYCLEIGTIRGELMTLDPRLKTAEVRALEEDLQQVVNQPKAKSEPTRERKPADILPPHLIPVGVVNTICKDELWRSTPCYLASWNRAT